jgi:hypothetical protein
VTYSIPQSSQPVRDTKRTETVVRLGAFVSLLKEEVEQEEKVRHRQSKVSKQKEGFPEEVSFHDSKPEAVRTHNFCRMGLAGTCQFLIEVQSFDWTFWKDV